jgi:hypothetical protein
MPAINKGKAKCDSFRAQRAHQSGRRAPLKVGAQRLGMLIDF